MAEYTWEELAGVAPKSGEMTFPSSGRATSPEAKRLMREAGTDKPLTQEGMLRTVVGDPQGTVPRAPRAAPREFTWEELSGVPEDKPVFGRMPGSGKRRPVPNYLADLEKGPPAEPMTKLEAAGGTIANLVSLADMVIAAPWWVAGLGADAGARALGALASPVTGETDKEIGQAGLRAKERVLASAPSITRALSGTRAGEAIAGSQVNQAMEGLMSLASRTGQQAEAATTAPDWWGPRVTEEDYLSLFDIASGAAPFGVRQMRGQARPQANAASLDALQSQMLDARQAAVERQGVVNTPQRPLAKLLEREQALDEQLATEQRIGGSVPYEVGSRPKTPPDRTHVDLLQALRKPGFQRTAEEVSLVNSAKKGALAVGGAAVALSALPEDEEYLAAAAMLPARLRNRDAFYTQPRAAKQFSDWVKARPEIKGTKEFIEPSAGAGDIMKHFPGAKGFDLEPAAANIVKADFLETPLGYKPGRVFVGNPPFGRQSSVAVKFLEKALREGDYAAFIAPPSLKGVVSDGIKGRLVAEAAFPQSRNFYHPEVGNFNNIRTTMQLWKRTDTPKEAVDLPRVAPADANIHIPRVLSEGRTQASRTPIEGNSISLKVTPTERARLLAYDWSKGYKIGGVSTGRATVQPADVKAVMQGKDPYGEIETIPKMTKRAALAVGGLAAVGAMMDEEELGGPALAMAAAVKPRAGNWLESTLGRVNPFRGLNERLEQYNRNRAGAPTFFTEPPNVNTVTEAFLDRAGDRYFKTLFGSEADPLKDVKIPGSERTFSEAAENIIQHSPAVDLIMQEQLEANPWLSKVPPDTRVYFIDRTASPARTVNSASEIRSALHHVADYLRQNVDPAKLAQYDLPRAVRETVANDARVAKEMERAAQASSRDLPTYKEYPDGVRWVELKLPEKLTEEQAKRVRPLAEVQKNQGAEGQFQEGWIATDEKGKPVENSYTQEPAIGRTPEEAFLAGQLAQEGNVMGHCVGGYCEGVASGESRIFSLRDKKGNAHVTVEVKPDSDLRWENVDTRVQEVLAQKFRQSQGFENFGKYLEAEHPEVWEKIRPGEAHVIEQIKGKQNRAPNAEYLPYVQDFVKSGKWGDVRDLENTGLKRSSNFDAFEGQPERYLTEREVLEGTREKVKGLLATEPKQPNHVLLAEQLGYIEKDLATLPPDIDPNIARQVALAGGGAALLAAALPEDQQEAALAAAPLLARTARGADYATGMMSTRLRNISPQLGQRSQKFEFSWMTKAGDWRGRVDPFLVAMNKLPAAKRLELERALLTGNPAETGKVVRGIGDPDFTAKWQETQKVRQEAGAELSASGRLKSLVADHWPRKVKDLEGLLAAVGSQARTQLETLLVRAEAESMKKSGTPLSEAQRSDIVNTYLLAPMRTGSQPAWAKGRRIGEITEQLQPFYYSATDTLHGYLRDAAFELEKAKFFGKDAHWVQMKGQQHINVDKSVGNITQSLLAKKEITPEQALEVEGLLKSRFGPGEVASRGQVQDFRNVTNTILLGNPISGITQFGDPVVSMAVHGMGNTLAAVGKVLTGKSEIGVKDIGLTDHISEEFVSTRATGKWLKAAFKWGGFSLPDQFGRETFLNAAKGKYESLAQTAAGRAQIARDFGPAYQSELKALVSDIQARKLTDRTRLFYFNQLARSHPVSKMEMSQLHADNPDVKVGPFDARSLFQLKSFMLKQADLARRDGYNEIKAGNKQGYVNLAKLGIALGAAGATTDMIKDFLLGKPFDAEWSDIPLNMLKTFGITEFMWDKIKKGKVTEAAGGLIAPPYRIVDEIAQGKVLKQVPIAGRVLDQQAYTEAGKLKDRERRMKKELRSTDDPDRKREIRENYEDVRDAQAERRLIRELERQ